MDERSGIIFHQLLRAHHNAHMAALTKLGVGDISSPHLLIALSHYPDDPAQAPTQKELAVLLHIAPPTIAASLKCLERQGYAAKRTDEKDSRRNRISITRKGREALESGMHAFQQVDDAMFRGFTPEERALVQAFHRRMLENLYQVGGDQDAEGPPPPPPLIPNERRCDPC